MIGKKEMNNINTGPNNFYVIYHGQSCCDGWTSAYTIWKHFNRPIIFIAGDHSDPHKESVLENIPDGSTVWILDFSFDAESMIKLVNRCQVLVIDHHASAQLSLESIKDNCIFDINECGSTLTFQFLNLNKPMPEVYKYIKDGDIWQWKLPNSKEVNAALYSYPHITFEAWDEIMNKPISELVSEGKGIVRANSLIIKNTCENFNFKYIDGHLVPVVNTTAFSCEIGNQLCLNHPDKPFAATWRDKGNGVISWGLYSVGDFNCSILATKFGGGGHPGASGALSKTVEEIAKDSLMN
jgi:uncharacterized protein